MTRLGFDPLLPWPVIAGVAALAVLVAALAWWRGLPGWPWRGLAGLAAAAALAGPTLETGIRRGLSDIKAADMAGSPSSFLFRGVDAIPNPGGFSDIYRSNRVPMFTAGAPASNGDCPQGTKVWPVFYGKVAGVMEYGELKIDESGTSENQPGKWFRHYEHYDWFARYPQLFGVAWVTDEAYNGAVV